MKVKNREYITIILIFALLATLVFTKKLGSLSNNPETDLKKFSKNPERCLQQANAEMKRQKDKCRDLSAVSLVKMMGATERYINGCLANLVHLQINLSQTCGLNIKYSPKFMTLRYERAWDRHTIDTNVKEIKDHCNKMGSQIRWFTECGAPEFFNTCAATFDWLFKFLNTINRDKIKYPRAKLSEFCQQQAQKVKKDKKDKKAKKDKKQNKSFKNKKECVGLGEKAALDADSKCLNGATQSNLPVCKYYEKRDKCRDQSDKEAKKWSKICGKQIILMRTMDIAPSDCRLCVDKANQELRKMIGFKLPKFGNMCDDWQAGMNKILKYNKRGRYFEKICGRGIRRIMIKYRGRPKECNKETTKQCLARRGKIIENIFKKCQSYANKIKDICKNYRAFMACFTQWQIDGENTKFVCGKSIRPPVPNLIPPPQCTDNKPKPVIIHEPSPVKNSDDEDSNYDKKCLEMAGKAHSLAIKTCFLKLRSMKLKQCGIINYRNKCYIDAIRSQFKPSEACVSTLLKYTPKMKFKSGCHPKDCLKKAWDSFDKLFQLCSLRVKYSRKSECAKAKLVNSCLKHFQWLRDYWNRTCLQYIYLRLPFINEAQIC